MSVLPNQKSRSGCFLLDTDAVSWNELAFKYKRQKTFFRLIFFKLSLVFYKKNLLRIITKYYFNFFFKVELCFDFSPSKLFFNLSKEQEERYELQKIYIQ